jgi:chromosomal replication initiation ATPase DnaA
MANAHKRCKEWSIKPVAWLYIHGAFGAGKSHLAAAIANVQQQSGKVVRFVTVNQAPRHTARRHRQRDE